MNFSNLFVVKSSAATVEKSVLESKLSKTISCSSLYGHWLSDPHWHLLFEDHPPNEYEDDESKETRMIQYEYAQFAVKSGMRLNISAAFHTENGPAKGMRTIFQRSCRFIFFFSKKSNSSRRWRRLWSTNFRLNFLCARWKFRRLLLETFRPENCYWNEKNLFSSTLIIYYNF